MVDVNDNFRLLPKSYLFLEVARRIAAFRESSPECEIIRMDIGDITRPLFPSVVAAMHKAVDELGSKDSFRGYGPEQGYIFLREAIAANDYAAQGLDIDVDDIFVSDGAKSDLGNLGDIYSRSCRVAIMNPAYPAYLDDTVIDGRAGVLTDGHPGRVVNLECDPDNGFMPRFPEEVPDVIFLCFPNNPTGEGITREALSEWVDYARSHGSMIIYDSAYESFVRTPGIVRSIYEIDGAEEVAIEVRSFSKTAGFTGLRCGYTVVPKRLKGVFADGSEVSLNTLWNRRQSTKFNGASYVSQRAAEAIYSDDGRRGVREATDYYLANAQIIKGAMREMGFRVYGGDDSPYVWATPNDGCDSWDIFGRLLHDCHFSTTPGVGFGTKGEGYVRLTGFNTRENTLQAMKSLKDRLMDKKG